MPVGANASLVTQRNTIHCTQAFRVTRSELCNRDPEKSMNARRESVLSVISISRMSRDRCHGMQTADMAAERAGNLNPH